MELIRTEIRNLGPQPFDWFMEQVLYHPEHGYYSSGGCVIGRKGDYFTNVSVGSLFGQLMVAQFVEIWEELGKINDFVIVEQGAHDGQFAHDVLQSLQERTPEFFEASRYRIIEPFPVLRVQQSQILEPFREKVEWMSSFEPFTGIHFSNELLDAMPVRMIRCNTEKIVDLQGGKLLFIERPRSSMAFNQAALDWVDSVAANLQRGYVITIDYGRSGTEFKGNVQVRARHRHLDSPFEQIGHADITMQVDWTSIARRAEANGLRIAGFTDQHHFLTGIISTWPDILQGRSSNLTALSRRVLAGADRKTKRALQTLLHPEMLGRTVQVVALAENADGQAPPLSRPELARA